MLTVLSSEIRFFAKPPNVSSNLDTMKSLLVILLFVVKISSAQNPYKDSLQGVYKIDEQLIAIKTDTILSFSQTRIDTTTVITERITICRDADNRIIRVDKIFQDSIRFAFAYFENQKFHLMQWNDPKNRDLYETILPFYIRNPDIRIFYLALLKLPNITMPEITTYTH